MTDSRNPPAGVLRLRVVSWNIHGCVGTDGHYDPGRIAEVLEGLDADIIGLQEVDWRRPAFEAREAFDYLTVRLGMNAVEGPNLHDHRGRYGNGLLTRMRVLEQARIDLAVESREPRGAIDAMLGATGATLRVAVTHLGLLHRERLRQIRRLSTALASDRKTTVSMLLGDMNEWLSPRRLRRELTPTPFASICSARTFPSRAPLFGLDCALFDPAPRRMSRLAIRSAQTRLASDHLPLVVDVEWDLRAVN